MHWTWLNAIYALAGLVLIAASGVVIRYRVVVFRFFVKQTTALYGKKRGDSLWRNAGPKWGIMPPGIGGIFIGTVFLLEGIFGHSH